MGRLLGNAVRFGKPSDVMAAGEGIETMLFLFPGLPMAAALSAAHLQPSISREAFAGFISFATITRRGNLRQSVSAQDAARPASSFVS